MSDLIVSGAVQARHNQNRWVVDCRCGSALGAPRTIAAIHLGPDGLPEYDGMRIALVFGVGAEEVTCWDCGATIGPIVWPADPVGIETVLAYRPDPATRSWEPHETIENLLQENFEHGVIPDEWHRLADNDPQLVIAGIQDQRITEGLIFDALPASDPRRVIAAARAEAHSLGLPYIEDDGYPSYPSHPELEG